MRKISELSERFSKINGFQMYFAPLLILEKKIYLQNTVHLGGWLKATLKLIAKAVSLSSSFPEAQSPHPSESCL